MKNNSLALVVGASKGLGRAVSLKLAQNGMAVIAVARSESHLAGLKQNLIEVSGTNSTNHQTIAADVTNLEGLSKIKAQILDRPISVCVHLVGGALDVRDPLCSFSDLMRVLTLNLESAVELNHILIPQMKAQGYGRIVHISSNAAVRPAGSLSYGVAKATLNSYIEKLAPTVINSGVAISGIMPGPIGGEGSLWQNRLKNNPEETKKFINERIPLGRFQSPEELAELVGLLCSPTGISFAGRVLLSDGLMNY